MKLDKETIVALVVCMVLLMAWPVIQNRIWPPPPLSKEKTVAHVELDKRKVLPEASKELTVSPKPPVSVEPASQERPAPEKTSPLVTPASAIDTADVAALPCVQLENEYIKATVDPNLAAVTSVVLKKYLNADKKSQVVLFGSEADAALAILPSGSAKWKVTAANMERKESGGSVQSVALTRIFKTLSGKTFEILQTWRIKDKYTIVSKVDVRNISTEPIDLGRLLVSAGGVPTIHNQCGDKVPFRENHEIDFFNLDTEKVVTVSAGSSPGFFAMITGAAKNAPKKPFLKKEPGPAKWVAVTNKYFTAFLIPKKPFVDGVVARARVAKKKDGGEYVVAVASGIVDVGIVKPGAIRNLSFECFAGPKKMKLLENLEPDAPTIMRLYIMGMVFLEPLSRLMLTALLWLKGWCGSYGLSIILLTLIVKIIFWPVTHKANLSMRKMQKIQPLMKEVRATYKDNPQKMQMEMMKLYKEHNVSPLGGCLPMLLQMPVFLALYATLSGSVEPRQASFLWASDLSLPDTIFTIPGLHLPIRPLMLMMTATMVLQQKLTPTAADPAQQKVMMFMPLLMLVMLYSLPSGLTLYWTVSQFISVAQLIVNKELERREERREAVAQGG